MKTICCACKRTKVDEGWQRLVVESVKEVSHGFCPDCHRKAMLKIGEASHKWSGKSAGKGRNL
ncbi:MAG: hypothetical protein KKB30_03345 [Proteobacteria bacterium]|nr:hypothetical protein [Pseudomonadota bacterium]MBU1717333.1 hypothetical protein [Pseudomonadota bacterium]